MLQRMQQTWPTRHAANSADQNSGCAQEQAHSPQTCRKATRSAHSGSLLLAASSERNSCRRKLGSAARAFTTSTLLNSVRLERVA